MNKDVIGLNAGKVWEALSAADAMGVKQLKKVTKLKDKELFAALGWLAREDKIAIATDDKDEKVFIISLI